MIRRNQSNGLKHHLAFGWTRVSHIMKNSHSSGPSALPYVVGLDSRRSGSPHSELLGTLACWGILLSQFERSSLPRCGLAPRIGAVPFHVRSPLSYRPSLTGISRLGPCGLRHFAVRAFCLTIGASRERAGPESLARRLFSVTCAATPNHS